MSSFLLCVGEALPRFEDGEKERDSLRLSLVVKIPMFCSFFFNILKIGRGKRGARVEMWDGNTAEEDDLQRGSRKCP